MKTFFFCLTICCIAVQGFTQSATVEKYTNGVQLGTTGIWSYTEMGFGHSLAVRSEAGLNLGILEVNADDTRYFLVPEGSIEPRWYYNLNKRAEKSASTKDNAANFISLKGSYQPGWYTIPSLNDVTLLERVSLVPTWGIRRNVGNHFNYEAGAGVGYRFYLGSTSNSGDIAINLHVRFGYKF